MGIHFAMDYLTEQGEYLNGEIETPSISAEGKNVIVIGAGDTGADCVATALRENCKSIVQFNKYTKQPEAIEFDENTYWPLAMPVFKMDYAHNEYEARFGFEPRAYGVQTMRYEVDRIGNVTGVYTQILEETEDGMVVVDGTERHWPADLVLLSIDLLVQKLLCHMLLIYKLKEIKLSQIIKILKRINQIFSRQVMQEEVKVLLFGLFKKEEQSLVQWMNS